MVGEGSYGCVHRPSLRCQNDKDNKGKTLDYKDTISKLTDYAEMNNEMKNYEVIEKLDNDARFYTGTPVMCMPQKDDEFNSAVDKCLLKGHEYKTGEAGLLVIKDGGKDLGIFAKSFNQMDPNNPESSAVLNTFWWEMVRILEGIQMFLEKNFIHFDLKEANIVYDAKKKRANFIDFGTLVEKKEIEEEALRGRCTRCISHWSYPFENQFLNSDDFKNEYKAKNINLFYSILNDVFTVGFDVEMNWKTKQALVKGKENNLLKKIQQADDIPLNEINSNSQIVIFYGELKSPNLPHLLKDFLTEIKTFLEEHDEWTYEKFLEKSLKTTDIFGVGIAFLYVLKYSRPFMEPAFFDEMYRLAFRMITPDLKKRYTIEPLMADYKTLLTKYIPDFAPLNQPVSNFSNVSSVSNVSNVSNVSKKEKKKKECLEGKIRNPATGRCIKDKTRKTPVRTTRVLTKECPEGKIRNPATGRCIKDKTRKTPVRTTRVLTKECPEGKIRNPATGRCIKNKTRKTPVRTTRLLTKN